SVADLRTFRQTTAPEVPLPRLSREAGVHLLQSLDVKGSLRRSVTSRDGREQLNEFEALVEDVKGHALTLNLIGTFLRDAHRGDIRRRDLFRLSEANLKEQGGHAFHVMDAYVRWMAPTGIRAWLKRLLSSKEQEAQSEGKRALAFLSLLGLFDRPAAAA